MDVKGVCIPRPRKPTVTLLNIQQIMKYRCVLYDMIFPLNIWEDETKNGCRILFVLTKRSPYPDIEIVAQSIKIQLFGQKADIWINNSSTVNNKTRLKRQKKANLVLQN